MSEIRLRNVSKELMAKAEKCQSALRKKTITDTVETLFVRFFQDQESIRQLQQRNSQLHKAIQQYYNKENASRKIMQDFIRTGQIMAKDAKAFINGGKKLIKQFGKKKGG